MSPPKTYVEEPIMKPDLVDLKSLDSSIRYDIRYATGNNFCDVKFYPSDDKAYMQRPAAEALVKVHKALAKEGYGLIIYDSYRPWYVTKTFYEVVPDEVKIFVANPDLGSVHNRGCAVDLSIFELSTGKIVDMGAGYDETTDRSFADYLGGTSQQRYYRSVLRRAMEEQDFAVYRFEWWHFDYKLGSHFEICNERLEDIGKTQTH